MNSLFLLSLFLFLIGIFGIFQIHKNLLIVLMSIELRFIAASLNFLISSCFIDDIIGQIFTILILAVAASESSIGLAIFVIYFRIQNILKIEFLNLIKG
jgi:NADH-quinone oxidoreductase subunit K